MATNTARRKSKSNQSDLLPGSVLDESVSSTNVPVHILSGESKKIQGPL